MRDRDHVLRCLQDADALLWQARGLLQAATNGLECEVFPQVMQRARLKRSEGDEGGMTMAQVYAAAERQAALDPVGQRVALVATQVASVLAELSIAVTDRHYLLTQLAEAEQRARDWAKAPKEGEA